MSAFHAAVRGILYGALTQQEQALAIMHLAGDADAEAVDRYRDTVAGLKRLVAIVEPDETGHALIEGSERMMRLHNLQGRCIALLPEFDIACWEIRYGEVDAMLRDDSPTAARAALREIARRLGIEYSEKTRAGEDRVTAAAAGDIDGFPVRIWSIVPVEKQVQAQRAELHLDLSDDLLRDLAVRACYAEAAQ